MQCSAAWLQVQGSPAVGTAGTLGGCLSGFREVEVSESAGPLPPCPFFGVWSARRSSRHWKKEGQRPRAFDEALASHRKGLIVWFKQGEKVSQNAPTSTNRQP